MHVKSVRDHPCSLLSWHEGQSRAVSHVKNKQIREKCLTILQHPASPLDFGGKKLHAPALSPPPPVHNPLELKLQTTCEQAILACYFIMYFGYLRGPPPPYFGVLY